MPYRYHQLNSYRRGCAFVFRIRSSRAVGVRLIAFENFDWYHDAEIIWTVQASAGIRKVFVVEHFHKHDSAMKRKRIITI